MLKGVIMDPAMIMVLVLCAGVLALLTWFELNSRRNEARNKQARTASQSSFEPLQKESQSRADSNVEKTKAA
jgi:Tfp pilus assembly protein PilV